MLKMANVIGIDLGTTYCCAAIFRNGKVDIIPCNEDGKMTMPSVVAFNEHGRLIGEQAKVQTAANLKNTVFDAKRLIGRKYDDPCVQEDKKQWPFEVIPDEHNNPLIRVEYKGKYNPFRPEEISGMILEKIKMMAQDYTGKPIDGAVITVPAYFNNAQREATKHAAEIAQLTVIRIINEPTAAALAYGFQEKEGGSKNILVFDLGGGTFDVTIMELDEGIYEVKATSGDTHLGGEDFDASLVEYCIKDIQSKHQVDISDNSKAVCRLRVACEYAKKVLSQQEEASIVLESLFNGNDYQTKVSRQRFEDLNESMFNKLMEPMQRAIADAITEHRSIDDIVFVGGSTRIPKIQQLVKDQFDRSRINNDINPDEAVAYGAAILAAKIGSDDLCEALQEMVLLDVTPLSLGIETVGGVMSVIIPRNTTVPVTRTKMFTPHKDNQSSVRVKVYEGERQLTKDNNLLGDFRVSAIPPRQGNDAQVNIVFTVDTNGILTVTAKCQGHNSEKTEKIDNQLTVLSKEEVAKLVQRAQEMRLDDEMEKERIKSRVALEQLCYRYKAAITSPDAKGKVAGSEREKVLTKVAEALSWIETHQDEKQEKYDELYKDVHDFCDQIRQKIYSNGPAICQETLEDSYEGVE